MITDHMIEQGIIEIDRMKIEGIMIMIAEVLTIVGMIMKTEGHIMKVD